MIHIRPSRGVICGCSIRPGRCLVCRCTDRAGCAAGCWWVDDWHTLCSRCAANMALLVLALRRQQEAIDQ